MYSLIELVGAIWLVGIIPATLVTLVLCIDWPRAAVSTLLWPVYLIMQICHGLVLCFYDMFRDIKD